jgi:peptide/nickel transport system ATP-binding protein
MTPTLEIEGLRVDLPGSAGRWWGPAPLRRRPLNLLDGIALAVAPREALGLVGESGSGKTTLARALFGLVGAVEGRLRFEGADLSGAAARAALRRRAGLVFQDPAAAFSPRMRLGRAVTEPLVIHGRPMPEGREAAAHRLLERVGLAAALARRYPHELSGGQARRAAVARALALDPALLVADEPTAGLDVSVQGEILNLLDGLREASGLALLVISHNLAVVRHVTDRLAVLYLGRLMETGPTPEIFAAPLHPYTQSLLAAEPHPDPRRRRADLALRGEIPSLLSRPSGCPFHSRCPRARARCRAEVPVLRDVAQGRRVSCHDV